MIITYQEIQQINHFRARNWFEINDESREHYSNKSDIKFKASMMRSNLYGYSDTYIHVKRTITIPNTSCTGVAVNNTCKNCTPFINCISEINDAQVDEAKDIDLVIPMHNLIECSDVYLKTSGSLLQYYRDEPALENSKNIIDFSRGNNNIMLFKFKQQITRHT